MPYPDHMFSDTFCAEVTARCKDAIDSRTSFNLVAMSGVGATFFVKYMQRRITADFVYINAYEMHDFTKQALYDRLAAKLEIDFNEGQTAQLHDIAEALKVRARSSETIVLLFHRFDRLHSAIDQNFYDNLRVLGDVDRSKIVMVFVTSEPLPELVREQASAALALVPHTIYFPGYSERDLREIMDATTTVRIDDQALGLAGGNHLLLQVLLGCQSLDNPLSDPMVELLIKDMYLGLDSRRRRMVESVLQANKTPVDDAFLLGMGFIREQDGVQELFSPVMTEYVSRLSKGHLPAKERKLFEFLKRHSGEVVLKQDIFDHVWSEDNGIATDWSLNALVYRLRKHSAFDKQRYDIESRKKEGYVLIDHLAD